ncbi:pilus assembly protein PilZ [Bacillus coahuilensis m2-6]|uniref:flagellar brake protein n=1 Tax=Bacillus coahuilensis TaxID=408580 RepID=UPI00075012F3|nr:PilZ domain-containing protein [Bacillus coahuilensis]KUP07795.1 pilus assembly protein PilZ [Bacillus coahuilensis m2-6]
MIKVGTSLMLETIHTEPLERYKCKVVEVDDAKIYIDYPIQVETNKTVFLIDGTQLKASFVQNQSPFLFSNRGSWKNKKTIPMIFLNDPGTDEYVKVQRRQFVRIDASVDVSIELTDTYFVPTITDDISAGGCAVLLPAGVELPSGMNVSLYLVLPMNTGESHYLSLKGEIIRTFNKEERAITSIEFRDLDEGARQTILRFCFDRQLALRKKDF